MHKQYDSIKTLGPQAAKLVISLYEQNRLFFDLQDVMEITGLSLVSARSFIRKLVDRGVSTRLKPGLFNLVPFELGRERLFMGNPLLIAREILAVDQGYYFSHGTALDIHGMLTQPQLAVIVSTVKARRPITVLGVEFRFVHCKSSHLFGLVDHWVTKQDKVPVSDLERTIIDGLKQPEYCGGVTEVAKGLWLRREDINVSRLIQYAKRLGIGAVIRRLGFILDIYKIGTPQEHEKLRSLLTTTYVRLDPVLPAEGKLLRRWRLQLNVLPQELLALVRT